MQILSLMGFFCAVRIVFFFRFIQYTIHLCRKRRKLPHLLKCGSWISVIVGGGSGFSSGSTLDCQLIGSQNRSLLQAGLRWIWKGVCCWLNFELILLFVDTVFRCWCWTLFRINTYEIVGETGGHRAHWDIGVFSFTNKWWSSLKPSFIVKFP